VKSLTSKQGEFNAEIAAGDYDLQVLVAGFRLYQKM
jgi:hypothetical protein